MTVKTLDSFYVRFYLGDEQDEVLARHLQQFNNAPRGAKPDEAKRLMYIGLQVVQGERKTLDREAVRHVVREALGETQSALIERIASIRPLSSPDPDSDVVRRAVQEAMQDTIEEIGVQERAQSFDLSDIRRVVDAALQQQLDRLSVQCNEGNEGQNKGQNEDGDDENDDEAARIDALMDTLGKSLLR